MRFQRPHAGQGSVTCGACVPVSSAMRHARFSIAVVHVRLSAGASFGALAQLGERLLCKQEVIGSIPIRSIGCVGQPLRRRSFLRTHPKCLRGLNPDRVRLALFVGSSRSALRAVRERAALRREWPTCRIPARDGGVPRRRGRPGVARFADAGATRLTSIGPDADSAASSRTGHARIIRRVPSAGRHGREGSGDEHPASTGKQAKFLAA